MGIPYVEYGVNLSIALQMTLSLLVRRQDENIFPAS